LFSNGVAGVCPNSGGLALLHSSSLGPGILQKGNPGSQILTPLTLFLIVHSLSLAQAWLF
jgi:hypothetical protein